MTGGAHEIESIRAPQVQRRRRVAPRWRIWPISALIVAACVAAALILPSIERHEGWTVGIQWDPSTAQATLAAIAGGMITLTGFVFTAVTLIIQTLQTQSPRLLLALDRSDRTPVLFGVFSGGAAYALVVLSRVTTDFVPSLSVTLAIALVLLAIGLFLRLLVTASMNDIHGQLEAFRDLGALPMDTDLRAMIADLNLDGPPIDPTTLTQEEMLGEIQKVVKALLGYGARLPKELMLFIKNMVFLDGAIASLAPDLDLFAEIAGISTYFAETHGERIAEQVGLDPLTYELDLTGIKGSFGVDPNDTPTLTYRELQERRQLIRSRFHTRDVG